MKKEKNSELTYQDVVQPVKLRILLVSLFDLRLSCRNNILDAHYLRSVDICTRLLRFVSQYQRVKPGISLTVHSPRKHFGNKFLEVGIN